jgi:predicted transcriptional regulator of viral defense system
MTRQRPVNQVTAVARVVRRVKDGPVSINAMRKTVLIEHLRIDVEPITRREVAAIFEINLQLASALISELLAEGLIQRVSRGRYHLQETPARQPPGGDIHV